MVGWQVVPVLHQLYEVYQTPSGYSRFQAYLRLIRGKASGHDLEVPPLGMANPMARPEVVGRLGAWLALGVEDHLATWVAALESEWPATWKSWPVVSVSLTYCDDLLGGWTNRALIELQGLLNPAAGLDRWNWIVIPIWSSETPHLETLRARVRMALLRVGRSREVGSPVTLGQVLRREAELAVQAGYLHATLDAEEAEYTGQVLNLYCDREERAVLVAALFGDQAAQSLGYTPLGLSIGAGLAWAREVLAAQYRSLGLLEQE